MDPDPSQSRSAGMARSRVMPAGSARCSFASSAMVQRRAFVDLLSINGSALKPRQRLRT